MPESKTVERQIKRAPFAAPHVFALAVIDGRDVASIHRLNTAETVIGRGGGVDIAIDDDEISKNHCVIRVDSGVCSIIDLKSLNGTQLNDRPLRDGLAQRMRHLDEVQIGDTRLLFLCGRFKQVAQSPPRAPEAPRTS